MPHDRALEDSSIPTRSLVLGMVRADGELRADELYRVAGECGMSDQQVRLCLRRLVAEGALEHRGGRGRKAVFYAPAAQSAILPELDFLAYAYRQDAGEEPWDGVWRLVAFSVPEARRSARDELRPYLLYLGAVALHGGLYATPNDIGELVSAEAERLGVIDGLTLAECRELVVGGERDPRRLAAQLWPLERLEADYRRFTERLTRRLRAARRSPSPDAALRDAFLTTIEFARVIEADPLLPPELLPRSWAGRRARALLAEAQAGLFARHDLGDASQLLRRLAVERTAPAST